MGALLSASSSKDQSTLAMFTSLRRAIQGLSQCSTTTLAAADTNGASKMQPYAPVRTSGEFVAKMLMDLARQTHREFAARTQKNRWNIRRTDGLKMAPALSALFSTRSTAVPVCSAPVLSVNATSRFVPLELRSQLTSGFKASALNAMFWTKNHSMLRPTLAIRQLR